MEVVLNWVTKKSSDLMTRVAWNEPMFIQHGTFILGFSVAKQHLAVTSERAEINYKSLIQFSFL